MYNPSRWAGYNIFLYLFDPSQIHHKWDTSTYKHCFSLHQMKSPKDTIISYLCYPPMMKWTRQWWNMLFLSAGLLPLCFGAAIPVSCGSIYKSFAQCLVTLGDSLGETEKDPNTQDIDAICRCVPVSLCVSLFSAVTTFQQNLVLLVISIFQ